MAWPGDLNSIHNPATNTSPPAAWGDGVRDALQYLAGIRAGSVTTSETTTSGTFTDLSTSGPAVTTETGTSALVIVSFTGSNSAASSGAVMSFAVSGATTSAASSNNAALMTSEVANEQQTPCMLSVVTLTAGSNTFTAKYRIHNPDGAAGTATFFNRKIVVIPLTA